MTQHIRPRNPALAGVLLRTDGDWRTHDEAQAARRTPWWFHVTVLGQLAILSALLGWLIIGRPV